MSFYRRFNGIQPSALPEPAGGSPDSSQPMPVGSVMRARPQGFAPTPVTRDVFSGTNAARARLPFLATDPRVRMSLALPGTQMMQRMGFFGGGHDAAAGSTVNLTDGSGRSGQRSLFDVHGNLAPAPPSGREVTQADADAAAAHAERTDAATDQARSAAAWSAAAADHADRADAATDQARSAKAPRVASTATRSATSSNTAAVAADEAAKKTAKAKVAVDTAKKTQAQAEVDPRAQALANESAKKAAASLAIKVAAEDKARAASKQATADAHAHADEVQRATDAQKQADYDAQVKAQADFDRQQSEAQVAAQNQAQIDAANQNNSGGGGGVGYDPGYTDPGKYVPYVDPTTGLVTMAAPSSGLLTAALSAVAGFLVLGPVGALLGGGGGYYVAKKVIASRQAIQSLPASGPTGQTMVFPGQSPYNAANPPPGTEWWTGARNSKGDPIDSNGNQLMMGSDRISG